MKTQTKMIGVITLILLASMTVMGASNLTIEQILNSSYDSTNHNISIGMNVDSMVANTALTNAVASVVTLEHQTSGTPANGIGLGVNFDQETSAGNTETIGVIEFATSDVTAGSEDASVNFKLMAAGAAAATKFSMGSTGILTLAGNATIDNATSATNLNITETTVTITGNEVVTGSVDITGAAGLILENDETITNSVNGTVLVTATSLATSGAVDITGSAGLILENDETITNSVNGTVLVTATTLATTGAIDVTGGGITLENDETITNASDGTLLMTAPVVEVTAALKLEFETSDPCGTFPEGSIFYNDTANVVCFCDQAGDDLKIVDGSACF